MKSIFSRELIFWWPCKHLCSSIVDQLNCYQRAWMSHSRKWNQKTNTALRIVLRDERTLLLERLDSVTMVLYILEFDILYYDRKKVVITQEKEWNTESCPYRQGKYLPSSYWTYLDLVLFQLKSVGVCCVSFLFRLVVTMVTIWAFD